jgi:hypothetical protein
MKVAVKIIDKKKFSEEDYQALLTETEILSELNHPHIVKYVCCSSLFSHFSDSCLPISSYSGYSKPMMKVIASIS